MIETESEYQWKKWGGKLLAIGLTIYGCWSIVIRESVLLGVGFIEVVGLNAIIVGVGYIGLGLFVFGRCFVPYSQSLYKFEDFFQRIGMLLFVIGVLGGYGYLFLDP